jgi:hypothetical protein
MEEQQQRPKGARRLLPLLLCVLPILGGVAVMEFGVKSSSAFELERAPESGLLRYKVGTTIRWGREGHGRTSVGRYGMIVAKAIPETGSVLFLGDSFTEALQVDDHLKFTERVEEILNRERQSPIATVNMALSGLNPAQYAMDLPRLRTTLRPRALVVQVTASDFEPTDLSRVVPHWRPASLRRQGEKWTLQEEPAAPRGLGARIKRRLIRWRLMSFAARLKWRLEPSQGAADSPTPAGEPSPSPTQAKSVGLDSYSSAAGYLLDRLRAPQGSQEHVWLLFLPRTPRLAKSGLVQLMGDSPDEAARRTVLRALCAERGIGWIDATEALERSWTQDRVFPHGFDNTTPGQGHLNPHGHAVVAKVVATAIAPALGSE